MTTNPSCSPRRASNDRVAYLEMKRQVGRLTPAERVELERGIVEVSGFVFDTPCLDLEHLKRFADEQHERTKPREEEIE